MEPIPALVAVFAVGVGLSLYATVAHVALVSTGRNVARPALESVHDAVSVGGVVRPGQLDAGVAAGPSGYRLNVTVTTNRTTWHAGPAPPNQGRVDHANRPVSVARGPGIARPGTLRVVVWT